MSEFTKGPWRVSKRATRRVTSETGVVICNAVLRNRGGPKQKRELKDEHEAEANAQLIAAAPDNFACNKASTAILEIILAEGWLPEIAKQSIRDQVALNKRSIARATGEQP